MKRNAGKIDTIISVSKAAVSEVATVTYSVLPIQSKTYTATIDVQKSRTIKCLLLVVKVLKAEHVADHFWGDVFASRIIKRVK